MRATTNGAICAGTRPTVTSGVPICALFSAIAQSEMATRPTPPPMAAPSISAITAFGSASAISSSVPKRRLEAAVASFAPPRAASEPSMPLRSPPAQKVPPAPDQHDDADAGIVARLLEGLRQLAHHRGRERIARLRPVHGRS